MEKKENVTPPEDELSPLAVGYMWSTRIMTIGLEMALVVYGGHWLDQRFGTEPILVLSAAVVAMTLMLTQLLAISKNKKE